MILFGDEYGRVESLSSILHSFTEGNNAKRLSLNEVDINESSSKPGIWIIITESTNTGKPPKNAVFFEYSLREFKPDLSNIKFTILGYGNSNYVNY